MMFSIIHNVYNRNPYVEETIRLNLIALREAEIAYEYIVFNDNGDKDIISDSFDVKKIVNEKLITDKNIRATLHQTITNEDFNYRYYYSDTNFGKKKCTGGWTGAIISGLVHGDIIHNTSQDDIMTPLFYRKAKECFNDSRNYFFTSNGFKVDEQLRAMEIMIHPEYQINYDKPFENFKNWFGIENNIVTRANNGMLASGTMYRTELHSLIGLPDLDNFEGAADFEYWANILYHGYKGKYCSMPTWYYRQSRYSAGNEIIDGLINRGTEQNPGHQQKAIQRIKEHFAKLVEKDDRFK